MTQAQKIVVHHLVKSRSIRIIWLLEELNLDYQIQIHQRDPKTYLATSTLTDIHPLGRAPVVAVDELVLAESGAIIDYFVENMGASLAPEDNKEAKNQYRYWMHFAEGTLMPGLVARLVFSRAKQKRAPFFIKPLINKVVDGITAAYYGPNLQQSLRYVDEYLAEHSWFAGNQFSAADIQMGFPLSAMQQRVGRGKFPAIDAYVERVTQREAYQRAVAKIGE